MKLKDVFPGSTKGLDLLKEKANAFDDREKFMQNVKEWPKEKNPASLFLAMVRLNNDLEQRADTGFTILNTEPRSNVFIWSGQQAYIDYSLGVVSKLEALNSIADDGQALFGLVGYDFFGSDGMISQTRIPTALPNVKDNLMGIRIHYKSKRKHKDMRFIPPPDKKQLDDAHPKMKGTLKMAFKYIGDQITPSEKREAFQRLGNILEDYEYARTHSRSVADFNTIWAVRVFRRLGYKVLFCEMDKLLDQEELSTCVAETLGRTIRENHLFVESVNQILRKAGDCDLRISHQELGYVPIFMTDEITGKRFPLKCNKIGPDHFLVSEANYGFKVNIGTAADEDVQAFLEDYKGRWSPNVFLPLFMYRCGFHGFVSGRSSLKYSIVIGHVMEKVFEEKHPPNLFCAGTPRPEGPLHTAVLRMLGGLPEAVRDCPPTLIYRLIFSEKDIIRREVENLWKG
jgi:hypothetical protein